MFVIVVAGCCCFGLHAFYHLYITVQRRIASWTMEKDRVICCCLSLVARFACFLDCLLVLFCLFVVVGGLFVCWMVVVGGGVVGHSYATFYTTVKHRTEAGLSKSCYIAMKNEKRISINRKAVNENIKIIATETTTKDQQTNNNSNNEN